MRSSGWNEDGRLHGQREESAYERGLGLVAADQGERSRREVGRRGAGEACPHAPVDGVMRTRRAGRGRTRTWNPLAQPRLGL